MNILQSTALEYISEAQISSKFIHRIPTDVTDDYFTPHMAYMRISPPALYWKMEEITKRKYNNPILLVVYATCVSTSVEY